MESKITYIPKLDFSGLEAEGTASWVALQDQVLCALQSYGCFEFVSEMVTSELRDALFDHAIPELFGLPLDTKLQAKTDLHFDGYIGQIPGWAYELLPVPEDVEGFTHLMWPGGNKTFCDTLSAYMKQLKDLEQIIVRMVFAGLGIRKHFDSYVESVNYRIQLSEYGNPLDKEDKTVLNAHLDYNLLTILQQLVEGLEIQMKGGEWIRLQSSPNTFTVIVGEAFQAWTNGRLPSPYHHVKLIGNENRYSAALGSIPKDDYIIQAPKELVDKEHPLVYKPYTRIEHLSFIYSWKEEGRDMRNLHDFCGTGEEELNPKA